MSSKRVRLHDHVCSLSVHCCYSCTCSSTSLVMSHSVSGLVLMWSVRELLNDRVLQGWWQQLWVHSEYDEIKMQTSIVLERSMQVFLCVVTRQSVGAPWVYRNKSHNDALFISNVNTWYTKMSESSKYLEKSRKMFSKYLYNRSLRLLTGCK